MFKSLKITCNEATTICDKNQYGEATFMEKVKLTIHFTKCKICSLYTKQNNMLTSIYKGYSKSCKEVKHCLTDEDKDKLKEELRDFKI